MDERSIRSVREHLQKSDAQERIVRNMQRARAEAIVTISQAAELFKFTENKLRDWEKYGFLSPSRMVKPTSRRLYTQHELDKLAIIRELIDAGYAPSDIPSNLDELWYELGVADGAGASRSGDGYGVAAPLSQEEPINVRIEQARAALYWRYYVSHALRLSLLLICEDVSSAMVGLLLPLRRELDVRAIRQTEDIPHLGETLVGWLDQDQSTHTFLTIRPAFQYSTDYRVQLLSSMKMGVPQESVISDPIFIVVPRETRPLTLGDTVVETIRRLLRPLYEEVSLLRKVFGTGPRDIVMPATDLDSNFKQEDILLNGLAEMVVRLGGMSEQGATRWRFCCIYLPSYLRSAPSLQHRSLVVRAQSRHAPHRVGVTTLPSQVATNNPCFSAFQSGHIIYLPAVSPVDSAITFRQMEQPLGSVLAVPIDSGEHVPTGVIYVVAEDPYAFSESDQRVLRMIGRMIGELLDIYNIRYRGISKLRSIMIEPAVVDPLFREFLSENEFIADVEQLLAEVRSASEQDMQNLVSFITVDIDNESRIASRYGDRVARELTRAVGLRILSQLRTFKDDAEYKLYHMYADRFYIMLRGLPLDQARLKAELLRQVLCGSYQIDPLYVSAGQPTLPENMVSFSKISVRLSVATYFYWKLKEVLQRFPPDNAIAEVRMQVLSYIDEALNLGMREGGNVVMSWEPAIRNFIRWSPSSK